MDLLKRLVTLYGTFEPVIDAMMPPSRRDSANLYCKSMTATNQRRLKDATSLSLLLTAVSGTGGEARYYKLNTAAYAKYRTVEFRHHSGTLDPRKARMWTQLCLRMVTKAESEFTFGPVATPTVNRARQGSKSFQAGQMMLRPEGATAQEVAAALGWPSVSMPQQAQICGLTVTTQRTGRTVRYFAATTAPSTAQAVADVTPNGFASFLGATDEERAYIVQRIADLSGNIAWAA